MDDSKRYESAKQFVGVTGFIIDALILFYLLESGSSIRLRQFAESFSRSPWSVVAIYVLLVGAIFKIFDLPLAFYSGYVLEHRFHLSRQSFAGWLKDQLKGLAIGVPLSVAAAEVIYQFLRAQGNNWWIYGSLAFVAVVIVVMTLAPVLILP